MHILKTGPEPLCIRIVYLVGSWRVLVGHRFAGCAQFGHVRA